MLEEYFAPKKRIYPQKVLGKFRNIKWKLNFLFLSVYCFSPLIRFERGVNLPNQGILIDLPGSKAYFFFIEIWPQEVYYLAGILIILAVALFFVTSLFGRVWCGYACFQTVWTDIFIFVERIFQGDRNDRILLDRKNNFQKFWRKGATHFCWTLISLLTGIVFVSYFNDSIQLIKNIFHCQISLTVLGWILGIASSTYLMAGFAREHVCTFMCPYARFQSAMFDNNTLIISYDSKRGEPRGKLPHDQNFENRGHCIDCKQCVVVCPTGIDIRNGLQMECIACGLCVDACDNVMEKIGLPKGLVRYDTLSNLINPDSKKKFRILQPRTFYYSAILIFVSILMLKSLILKAKIETEIIPERNPIFVTLSDGSIRNDYKLKIINKTHETKSFNLKIIKPKSAILKVSNQENEPLQVGAESINDFKIYIILPKDFLINNQQEQGEGRGIIDLILTDTSDLKEKEIQAIFISK